VIATTPNNAAAAIMAIMAIDVFVVVVISLSPLSMGGSNFPLTGRTHVNRFGTQLLLLVGVVE
jgi:hypothetical protein